MRIKEQLYRMTDEFKGEGFPFFFAGWDGVEQLGFTDHDNVKNAQADLDLQLLTRRKSATYLSQFQTDRGALGYLAYG